MNVQKDFKMLWHMFSIPLDIFKESHEGDDFSKGLNIIIMKKEVNEKESFKILNPQRTNHQ